MTQFDHQQARWAQGKWHQTNNKYLVPCNSSIMVTHAVIFIQSVPRKFVGMVTIAFQPASCSICYCIVLAPPALALIYNLPCLLLLLSVLCLYLLIRLRCDYRIGYKQCSVRKVIMLAGHTSHVIGSIVVQKSSSQCGSTCTSFLYSVKQNISLCQQTGSGQMLISHLYHTPFTLPYSHAG